MLLEQRQLMRVPGMDGDLPCLLGAKRGSWRFSCKGRNHLILKEAPLFSFTARRSLTHTPPA